MRFVPDGREECRNWIDAGREFRAGCSGAHDGNDLANRLE
jgi:hypothetical protein